jgi:chromate transporter
MNNSENPAQTERPRDLTDLFWSLNALALQGFGGVIGVAQRVLVEKKRWYSAQEFVEAWAVAQVMPGPNIINLGAELGSRYFGLRGVFVAIAGLLTVPFLITITLAALYTQFSEIAWVAGAVKGMAAVSAGLIMAAGLRLAKTLPQHILGAAWTAFFTLTGFVMVALLRWPLSFVLLGLGALACLMTGHRIKQQQANNV